MSSLWPSPEDHAQLGDEPEPDYLSRLKHLINLVDRAMGEEGIPAHVRDRVVARVLHGTPTPGATPDWAEPDPHDLAIIDMLADAAPDMNKTHPLPQIDGVGGAARTTPL